MGLHDALRRAAGLLVELPPDAEAAEAPPADDAALDRQLASVDAALKGLEGAKPTTKTVEQIVKEAPGPDLDKITVAHAETDQPVAEAGGKSDFAPIYQRAGLPPAPFTAEQMLEMLGSLPPELPLETRRQTVKVTLGAVGKSIGATPETILADASRKLAALAAYSDALAKNTAETVTKANFEIAALQAQIEERRKAIAAAQARQTRITDACTAESARLDDVLEFFSLDVPPSRNAPSGGSPAGGAATR